MNKIRGYYLRSWGMCGYTMIFFANILKKWFWLLLLYKFIQVKPRKIIIKFLHVFVKLIALALIYQYITWIPHDLKQFNGITQGRLSIEIGKINLFKGWYFAKWSHMPITSTFLIVIKRSCLNNHIQGIKFGNPS